MLVELSLPPPPPPPPPPPTDSLAPPGLLVAARVVRLRSSISFPTSLITSEIPSHACTIKIDDDDDDDDVINIIVIPLVCSFIGK